MSDNQDLNRRTLLATAGVVGVGALAATGQAHAQAADQPTSVKLSGVKLTSTDSVVNVDLPNVTWRAIKGGGSLDITVPIDLGDGKTVTLKCYPFGLQGAVAGSINVVCF